MSTISEMKQEALRAAAVGIALSATAALVSCTPEAGPPTTAPVFAFTSADVVYSEGREYPINFIFLAEAADPIWTDLTGVVLPGDASVGPGQFEVLRGDEDQGMYLGNIAFNIAASSDGIAFGSIGLVYEGRSEPVEVPVGSWSLREAPEAEFVTSDTRAEVAAIAGCTSADLPVPDSVASVQDFETGSQTVDVVDMTLNQQSSVLTVSFTCTDDSEFHIVSPSFRYIDTNGEQKTSRLAPIAMGFQDIDETDLKRIRER